MRVVSKNEVNKMALTGAQVRKITEKPKPAPVTMDLRPEIIKAQEQAAAAIAKVREVALGSATEQAQIKKLIVHMDGQLRELKNDMAIKRIPPTMELSRGVQGFISTVKCGSLVFKFNRNRIGTVLNIDIITTD